MAIACNGRVFKTAAPVLTVVRGAAVLAQAVTILVTWRVWEVRDFPPLLPVIDFPQVAMARPMLVSLVLVLVRPRLGVPIHVVLLLLAMLLDQTRIQPYTVSCAILMVGTLETDWAQPIARAHLIALWFYAGLHKVIGAFIGGIDSLALLDPVPWLPDQSTVLWLSVFTIGAELLVAALVLPVRTRKAAAVLAVLLHVGILLALVTSRRNVAVWPWQFALAIGGFAFIWNWRATTLQSFLATGPIARFVVVLFLISPLGYYLGLIDPYLAHCLYSNNTPSAWIESAAGIKRGIDAPGTNVIVQPTARIYTAYFTKVAQPGDVLVINHGDETSRIRAESAY